MDYQLNGIVESLENKSILVTGSTGFLSKIFVEKLLRVQPNMKQLFLLIRAPDAASATQRLHKEVTGKEVFRVLKEKYGAEFDSFIFGKITPVAGDIALENCGIQDIILREKIWKEVDVVANFAANTILNQRYDLALATNTRGAKHVMDFAQKCQNLKILLHISTAYVCGERLGVILEKPFKMGETLTETSEILDIELEMKLANQRLNQLQADHVSMKEETDAMIELGLKRARLFGWQNAYIFTKAMGEMVIHRFRQRDLPLVIIRPTTVTSTYREPFPGWIEGYKSIDPFIVSCGKGKIPCFIGNHESILDLIPGDMVVNAIIVAMVAHAKSNSSSSNNNDDDQFMMYHVGSSTTSDPMNIIKLGDYVYQYFSKNKNPWKGKDGKSLSIVKPVFFPTMATFRKHIHTNYTLLMKEHEVKYAKRLAEILGPLLVFIRIFDDSVLKKLRMALSANKEEAYTFYFDPKCIHWEDYLVNVHIPGFMNYAIKLNPLEHNKWPESATRKLSSSL